MAEKTKVKYGPIEFVALGFKGDRFTGKIASEIKRLEESNIMRLIGLLLIRKDKKGNIELVRGSDLTDEEAQEFGAYAGALMGYGIAGEEGIEPGAVMGAEAVAEHEFGISDEQIEEITDEMPTNTSAVFLLFEDRWALDLKQDIADAGGTLLAQGFVRPETFVAYGQELARQMHR